MREIIANALIHQDFGITGASPMIDLFKNRLEISNPGTPLIDTKRMIDLSPRSRNEKIALFMRLMQFSEERGTGIKKVIRNIEEYQMPPPRFSAEHDTMQVTRMMEQDFASMTLDDRITACYQHAVIKWVEGGRLRNKTLCERFGLDPKRQAAYVTPMINAAIEAGYIPAWA